MGIESIIIWLIVGAIAGWLAGLVVKGGGFGIVGNIVVGIIGLLLVLIVPAFTSMKSGSDFTNAVYGIQGVLDSARIYAKANRTYVFVGFAEVDSSVSPQVTTGSAPYGRVAVAVVASKNGTRQFVWAASGPGGDWTANYSTHGVVTPTPPRSQDAGNHAVVQLGTTDGAVRVYRP